jgi:hypothetical protein
MKKRKKKKNKHERGLKTIQSPSPLTQALAGDALSFPQKKRQHQYKEEGGLWQSGQRNRGLLDSRMTELSFL